MLHSQTLHLNMYVNGYERARALEASVVDAPGEMPETVVLGPDGVFRTHR